LLKELQKKLLKKQKKLQNKQEKIENLTIIQKKLKKKHLHVLELQKELTEDKLKKLLKKLLLEKLQNQKELQAKK